MCAIFGGDSGTVTTSADQTVAQYNASKAGLDPTAPPDLTDPVVQRARRNAMRMIASKQGLGSTFLTGPSAGTGSSLLSGGSL